MSSILSPRPPGPAQSATHASIRIFALLAAGLLLGTLSQVCPAENLTFDWPIPAVADVAVDVERKGQQASLAYRLKVSDTGTGEYRIDYQDARLLSMNGQDLSSPAAQAALPPAVSAVTKALPSFIVGADGKLKRFLNLDRLLDVVISHVPEDPPQVTREKLRAALSSPKVRQTITAKAADDWNAWAGTWVGQPLLEHGERREFRATSRSVGGDIPGEGFYEDLGPVPDHPDRRRLRLQVTAEGPEFAGAIFRMVAGMAEQAGQPIDGLTADKIRLARRVHRIEVITDPATLIPYEVETLVDVTFQVEGEEISRQRERKRFRFDWD